MTHTKRDRAIQERKLHFKLLLFRTSGARLLQQIVDRSEQLVRQYPELVTKRMIAIVKNNYENY